jgi:uncharacterized DUF497 family protein
MELYDIIWKQQFVDKINDRHDIDVDEVEYVLFSSPYIRRVNRGHVNGEDVYAAYGRSIAGRYIIVFFILKAAHAALPISARDMTTAERRYFDARK